MTAAPPPTCADLTDLTVHDRRRRQTYREDVPGMTEHCPTCHGVRVVDDPDALAQYVHEARCSLARAERETWDEDRARFRRYGTPLRRRPTAHAARASASPPFSGTTAGARGHGAGSPVVSVTAVSS